MVIDQDYQERITMSVPAQLPLLNTKSAAPAKDTDKVKPAEAAKAAQEKDRDEFKKAMQAADGNKNQSAEKSEPAKTDRSSASEDGNETGTVAKAEGNTLPEEETSDLQGQVAVGANTQVLLEQTLKLDLGVAELSAEQADDAVLLATRFVVDNLPAALKETAPEVSLTGNATNGKPDILLKLQAHIQQASLNPVANPLDSDALTLGSLGELGEIKATSKISTTLTQVESLAAQSNQVNAAEAKATAGVATRTELVVPNRVGSEGWSEAMAGRISLLVNQRISSARIHINPPELGPIEVRVNLNNDQASVQFTSQSAQVRDALEQSIPRLRDMLESAGFSLADSDVNDQGGGERESQSGSDGQELAEDTSGSPLRRESLGLVDDYV